MRRPPPATRSVGDDDVAIPATPGVPFVSPITEDVRARLAEAMPDERHDVLVDVVRRAIARVLRVAEPDKLPREQPLLDLGFDSLMAVELRNVLRQGLALERKLPATLVFDHPTIAAIATYLEHMLAAPPSDGAAQDRRDAVDPVRAPAPLAAAAVADLSEDEVEAMLLRRLTEIER